MDKEKLMTEEEWLAKYNAGQNKSKKKSARKWIRNGVALGLVAVVSVAGTLAYLQNKTTERINTFTGSTGLKLSLTESRWDTNNDGNITDADIATNQDTNNDGQIDSYDISQAKDAEKYIPGNSYAKNPQLVNQVVANGMPDWNLTTGDVSTSNATKNTSGYTYSEYVALEVDLVTDKNNKTPLTYTRLTNAINDIEFDASWMLIAYYNGTSWMKTTVGNAYIKSDGTLDTVNFSELNSATKFVFAYGAVGSTENTYTSLEANAATTPLFSKITIRQPVKDFSSDAGVEVPDGGAYPEFHIVLKGAAVDTNKTDFTKSSDEKITTELLKVLGITVS